MVVPQGFPAIADGSDAKYGTGNLLAQLVAANWFARPGTDDGDVDRLVAALDAMRDRFAQRLTDSDVRASVRFAQQKLTPNRPRSRPRSVNALARTTIATLLDATAIPWNDRARCDVLLTYLVFALTAWWAGRVTIGLGYRQLLETRGAPGTTGAGRARLWRHVHHVLSLDALTPITNGRQDSRTRGTSRVSTWTVQAPPAPYIHVTAEPIPPGVTVNVRALPVGWWRGLSLDLLADRIRPTVRGAKGECLPPLDAACDALWGADPRLVLLLAVLRTQAGQGRALTVDELVRVTGATPAVLQELLQGLADAGFVTCDATTITLQAMERTWTLRAAVVADHAGERALWTRTLETMGPQPEAADPTDDDDDATWTIRGNPWAMPTSEREPGEDDDDATTPTWWPPPSDDPPPLAA